MNLPLSTQSRRRSPRFWIVGSVLSLAALVVVWYAIVITGISVFGWSGKATRTIARWTPLPIAIVDWHPLWYKDFFEQRAAVMNYSSYLAATTSGIYQSTTLETAGATAASTMVRARAAEQVLKSYGVKITTADVDQAYQAQLTQIGNPSQVAATIQQLYGWTPEQFKQYVISTNVVRDKLQEKLSFDETYSGNAKQQAEQVLALVTAQPESFSDLAKQYSDDSYGVNGGDLGFVSQGEQAQEIDDVAFSIELNNVSGLIHTKYGYHIIRVTERKTTDGVEQAHVWQITILAPQVDDVLTTHLQAHPPLLFIPKLHWDSANHRVSS